MDFLGIGAGEIILILLIGLIIWGPGRLIEISRSLGRTVRTVRKATTDLTVQVSKELENEKKAFREEKKEDN